jgi:D-alanyl-D-alanine carboxypeptidase/D-alanyl-D-alanine-endopeptidase (penicillin-binding protein 4)
LILKDSNNLVTDALFAKLTHRSSWPRNWDFAGRVLKDHIERIFGVVFSKEDKINSGSGLSLYNRLTPLTLTHILRKAHAHLGQEFVEFLAQGGVDGTLQDRLKNLPACSKISGKTGHLHGVTSFGGYVQKNGKDPYVVSVFIEGDNEKAKERRELLDGILMTVLASA